MPGIELHGKCTASEEKGVFQVQAVPPSVPCRANAGALLHAHGYVGGLFLNLEMPLCQIVISLNLRLETLLSLGEVSCNP